jgi:hypothetical protein
MDHKIAISQFAYAKLSAILFLTGMVVCAQAQTPSANPSEPKIIIRAEPTSPEKGETPISDPALGEGRAGSSDCEQKFPMPPAKKASDPYVEDGGLICQRLVIRGQQMQCEIDKLVNDRSGVFATTSAKTELANWARCNEKIASLLVGGFYLPASEIERRLQICSSNFYADPGKAPKLGGIYTRFIRWVTSNDRVKPPDDAVLEAAIKQSTPLNSQENTAGLMKCEWMFSTSKTPQIDPLPSLTPSNSPSGKPVSPSQTPNRKPNN